MKTRRWILFVFALVLMLIFLVVNLSTNDPKIAVLTGYAFWGSFVLIFVSLIGWRPDEDGKSVR